MVYINSVKMLRLQIFFEKYKKRASKSAKRRTSLNAPRFRGEKSLSFGALPLSTLLPTLHSILPFPTLIHVKTIFFN